jgi:quinoprotein glucose dehydrogenase
MKKALPLLALCAGFHASTLHAESTILQAFEGDGFDTWQTTGAAFGLAPLSGKDAVTSGELRNYAGHAAASSGHEGDAATGTLTSPEIVLSKPYLGFLVAGGNHPGKTAVQLLVDGTVVQEANGQNDLTMRPVVWNVSAWKGRKARIRILDDSVGSWGIIAADHFLLSDEPTPPFPKSDASPRNHKSAADALQRVEGEPSAAVVPGLRWVVSGSHADAGVTSPTAIAFGNDGSLFVAETHRFRFGVEDDRSNLYWYHDDLASKTVADRMALHEKWFTKRSRDWMTAKSERILRLSGENPAGVFSKSSVFAEQFNDVLDGTAAGILAWDSTVYLACIPKLWMLQTPSSGEASPQRKVIEEGFGVRVSLSGHDMNGFVLGYDGRLWGTIGDRGFHVTTKEGRTYPFSNQGAVFRFEPDGSRFEVVHTGLRNPKELAFDEWGNGISVDNNSDQGDRARIVYVVEGADSGWEMEHQAMHTFHREIGIEKRPPSRWMNERAWDLQNPEQPAFLIPPAAHLTSGPSGLTYHPGAGFLGSEAGRFHICDYRGSGGASGIWSFRMEPEGAGMKMTESHKLLWGVAATDVEYDWKGRLVVSDFVTGWSSHEDGRVITLTAEAPFQAEAAASVAPLIQEGFSKRSSDELAKLLAHPDQRVRLRAQLELTRRSDGLERFSSALNSSHALERLHGIWGLGILARRGPAIAPDDAWKPAPPPEAPLAARTEAAQRLVPLLSHADAEVRAQAVRVLEEAPLAGNELPLAPLILDPSPRVRAFAAIAAARLHADKFLPEILAMLRENADRDPILRHAGAFAIFNLCKTPDSLAPLAKDPNESVRLALTIALRRRGDESLARLLSDPSTRVADEAIRAIHDLGIEAARPAVAALIDRRAERSWTPFMLRRLVHSAFRIGGAENAARVVAMASDRSMPEVVRSEALRLLGQWTNPYPVDQSTGHWAPLPPRPAEEVRPSLTQALAALLSGDSDALRTTLELVDRYALDVKALSAETLLQIANRTELSGPARAKALEMFLARKTPDAEETARRFANDARDEVAMVAIGDLAHRNPEQGVEALSKAVADASAARRQGAWKALAQLKAAGVEALFVAQLQALEAAHGVSPAALELMEAAAGRSEPAIQTALQSLQKTIQSSPNPIAKWMPALEGGNPEAGLALFLSHPGGQCLRCHKASTENHSAGGDAGPNLAGVAKRGARSYLLESIVSPSAVVVSGYGTVNVELRHGGALTATLLADTPEHVDVDMAGQRWRIARTDIRSMSPPVSAMPPMEGMLKPSEVRDLVAWLATLEKGQTPPKAPAPRPLDISTIQPAAKPAPADGVDPAVHELGRQQFALCVACHGPKGEGSPLAPPLANSDWVSGPAENLIRIQLRGLQGPITVSGKSYTPPVPMPPQVFQTDEQIAAVLTYIRSQFGNSASPVRPDQVKALRGEAGKPPLNAAELRPAP